MKKLFFYFMILVVTSLVLTLCKKNPAKGEKLNGEELKTKYAIVLPDLEYEGDEIPTVAPGGKGGTKAKAASVTFTVFVNALPITLTDSTMTSAAPINTDWFGGQKFVDSTTNDGAKGLWACGRYFSPPATISTPVTCHTEGPGYYRFFGTDISKNVYLSKFELKP